MQPSPLTFSRILVVCVGNICRSPMAEAILRARLAPLGVKVESAGVGALVGRPADPTAVALMQERGLDLSGHRARQLTPELVREFDLVLVMESGHVKAVEQIAPTARGRVRRLGHWGNFDVPDPYRRDRAVFERALALIDQGVEQFVTTFYRGKP